MKNEKLTKNKRFYISSIIIRLKIFAETIPMSTQT